MLTQWTLHGYKSTVTQLVIEIYSTANGVFRTALISVLSIIKMSDRDLKFVYLFCQTGMFQILINQKFSFFFLCVL